MGRGIRGLHRKAGVGGGEHVGIGMEIPVGIHAAALGRKRKVVEPHFAQAHRVFGVALLGFEGFALVPFDMLDVGHKR